MTSLFSDRQQAEDREAAALVKRRVSVGAAAKALGLLTEAGHECPACRHVGGFDATRCGTLWRCMLCRASGDAVTLARLARGFSFRAALSFLSEIGAAPDRKTRELF